MKYITKRFFYSSLVAFLFLTASCESKPVTGTNYVIFCAPGLEDSQAEAVFFEIRRFIAGDLKHNPQNPGMNPGDTIAVFDANSMQRIGPQIVMPSNARTQFKKSQEAAPMLKMLRNFLIKEPPYEGLAPAPINIPRLVSNYKEMLDSSDAKVLMIGSPLYHDDVPAHDMREGWLSDGYFAQPPSVTVFSVQNKEKNLRGHSFRICAILDEKGYGTENKNAHQDMIKRFWAIFLNKCGGSLVSFQSDIATAFKSLRRDDLEEIPHEFDPNDKEMGIRTSKTELLPKITTATQPVPVEENQNSATQATDLTSSRSHEELSQAAASLQGGLSWLQDKPEQFNETHKNLANLKDFEWKTRIGLKWPTNAEFRDMDLDLYVRPKDASHELSFRKTESLEGKHLKDFPADSIAKYGFEIVDLHTSTDPANLQIWVNAYSGKPPSGFQGEVRILHRGVVKAYPIQIKATSGNQGRDANNRNRSPYWTAVASE
jgi:hypothetical protein